MKSLRYIVADDEELERLERTSFNPPNYETEITEDEFDAEWCDVRDRLGAWLSQRARPYVDSDDWGDFSLSESRGDSRWVYITFHTTKLWKRDFCEFVAQFLRGLPKDYCVGCTTEAHGLEALIKTPVIYLAITKDAVRGTADRMELMPDTHMVSFISALRKVGFPRNSLRA